MLLKLISIIVAAGAVGSVLLVSRQRVIETAHEVALVHREMTSQRRMLWQMQAQISARCRPAKVQAAVDRLGGRWVVACRLPNGSTNDLRALHADRPGARLLVEASSAGHRDSDLGGG